jgi:hypothetical protein
MNEVFSSYKSVQKRCDAVPGWMDRLRPAITREDPGHGYWFDRDHPAWIEAKKRSAPDRLKRRRVSPQAAPEVTAQRKAICEACEHNGGIRRFEVAQVVVLRVKCAKCPDCSKGRSLSSAAQQCPEGKW